MGRARLARGQIGHVKFDMPINIHVETPNRQLDMQIWASGIRPKWRCRWYLNTGTTATMRNEEKKGRGFRTESWAAPSIRDQREEEMVECGRRRSKRR